MMSAQDWKVWMSTPLIEDLIAQYFAAPSTVQQERVIRKLGDIGGDPRAPRDEWLAAARGLIELLHLAQHPRERVRVLRGFKSCRDRPFVVPALLGELDEEDSDVIQAALEALGHVGVHYAGAAIANWLDGLELETLEPTLLETALISLAQIGWPDAGDRVVDAFLEALIGPEILHLALAEAVDERMTDLAIEHLSMSAVAPAAALHLAMIRHPDMSEHLQSVLVDAGPELALLFHQMMEPRRGRNGADNPPADLLYDAVFQHHPTRRRRLARRLRSFDVDAVIVGFEEVADLIDASDGEDDDPVSSDLIQAAMAAGIPELQDAVLKRYAGDPYLLSQALRRLHSPTTYADKLLGECLRHENQWVATESVRARFNAFGAEAAELLDSIKNDSRSFLRVEWVRLQQNAWMLRRDHRNRIPVEHERRQRLVADLRGYVRSTDSERKREKEQALYVIGNLDLNEMSDVLIQALQDNDHPSFRVAAANSMGELELPALLSAYPAFIVQEQDPAVLFRLMRAANRALAASTVPQPEIATAVLERLQTGLPQRSEVMALKLLGRCRSEAAVDVLLGRATDERHTFAAAAITALGLIGSPRSFAPLIEASRHPDDERRICAVSALGLVGGEIAQHRLLDLLDQEDELPVRSACLAALRTCGVPPALADRLNMANPEDPLALELIQLRLQSAPGRAPMSADEIDRSLEKDIAGLDSKALGKVSKDALESFRTAQHLYLTQAQLPAGFDTAGSVLLWNKALEVWLNRILKKNLLSYTDMGAQTAIEHLEHQWWGMQSKLAPDWKDTLLDPKANDLWRSLLRTLRNAVRNRSGFGKRNQSLSVLATALLISAGPQPVAGFARWSVGIGPDKVQFLVNGLVALARKRNRLTHEEASDIQTSDRVRTLAIECAVLISQMKSKPISRTRNT
jgi:HEAT repeat protein